VPFWKRAPKTRADAIAVGDRARASGRLDAAAAA
jgi:hypothetical protein